MQKKLDFFVRGLSSGTALVLQSRVETPSQWTMAEGLDERYEGRLRIDETKPNDN
jgi:hypothetical protein